MKEILENAEKDPAFIAIKEDQTDKLIKLLQAGLDPEEEVLPGISYLLFAEHLGKERCLHILSKGKAVSPYHRLRGVRFLSALQFANYKLFKKVWLYSQEYKKSLSFNAICYGKIAEKDAKTLETEKLVVVKPSHPAVGDGLFALKKIPKNTFLGEYTGYVKPWNFFNYGPGSYRFQYPYMESEKKPKFVVDADEGGNWTRFVNHSFSPNAGTFGVYSRGMIKLIMITKKDVQEGEEFTIDYGELYWKKRPKPVKL